MVGTDESMWGAGRWTVWSFVDDGMICEAREQSELPMDLQQQLKSLQGGQVWRRGTGDSAAGAQLEGHTAGRTHSWKGARVPQHKADGAHVPALNPPYIQLRWVLLSPQFTDEETEAQSYYITCSSSHRAVQLRRLSSQPLLSIALRLGSPAIIYQTLSHMPGFQHVLPAWEM